MPSDSRPGYLNRMLGNWYQDAGGRAMDAGLYERLLREENARRNSRSVPYNPGEGAW
jgi:hypothetical protein